MALKLEYRLCLDEVPVPVQTQTLEFKDLFNQMDGDEPEQEFLTLNLKAHGNMHWLHKALELPWTWWAKEGKDLPLMHEIKEILQSKKPSSRRMPKNHTVIVAIEVRSRSSCRTTFRS